MASTGKRTRPTGKAGRQGLPLLQTGVPGFDEVLGGGLPALSFNLLAGSPGAGKTTLAMQLLFANATRARPGLFITLLGEPSLKLLRYQQRFDFFEVGRVGSEVHIINLSEEALLGDLDAVLARITTEVDRLRPGIIVVDSFRSLVRTQDSPDTDLPIEHFVQRLALHLTTWEVTSFLIGEYEVSELRNPVFTVADGIIWLAQAVDRNSVVRKVQVVKMRGMATMPGLHTLRMGSTGIQVFPRTPERRDDVHARGGHRLSTGIAGLDALMGGGIPAGDSLVLAGPTGTGKTTFAMHFIAAGLLAGEAAVIAIFEEHPEVYLERARHFGVDLREAIRSGKLRIIYLRPLDLSVDETLDEIRSSVNAIGAKRVVIDSISGFEMALAPTFREDFRESFYRLIGALTGLGVTVYSTVEVVGGEAGLQLTGYQVSFLTDEVLSQRYVEMEGELRKVLVVVKMRGSDHSRNFCTYELTAAGVQIGPALRDYDGILTGSPVRMARTPQVTHPGLTRDEVVVLDTVMGSGPVTAGDIAQATRLPREELAAILDRLLKLSYITRNRSRYAAEARSRDR